MFNALNDKSDSVFPCTRIMVAYQPHGKQTRSKTGQSRTCVCNYYCFLNSIKQIPRASVDGM